jgi:hypothetical protein
VSTHVADFTGLGAALLVTCGKCREPREVRLDGLPDDYGALREAAGGAAAPAGGVTAK